MGLLDCALQIRSLFGALSWSRLRYSSGAFPFGVDILILSNAVGQHLTGAINI